MGGSPPRAALDRLIARHGARAVMLGLLAALLRGRPRHRPKLLPIDQISPHLRRDLGLLPHRPAQPPRHWNHY